VKGGVANRDGLDVAALDRWFARYGTVAGFEGGEAITNEQLLEVDCDYLVPAAIQDVITAENAGRVRARAVVEAANHPVSPEGDAILAARGITVLPDILVNAGGVTVSYFEWTQNIQQFRWTLERVNNELEIRMVHVFNDLAARAAKDGTTLREAAFDIGIEKVARTIRLRGFV
jgi:glutamate dehydrogenase (NAD(P)+)